MSGRLASGGQTHIPPTHVDAPVHACVHAPQFALSVASVTSQPLAGFASQLAKPALHARVQLPALHPAVDWVPLGHAVHDDPHVAGSPLFEQ